MCSLQLSMYGSTQVLLLKEIWCLTFMSKIADPVPAAITPRNGAALYACSLVTQAWVFQAKMWILKLCLGVPCVYIARSESWNP